LCDTAFVLVADVGACFCVGGEVGAVCARKARGETKTPVVTTDAIRRRNLSRRMIHLTVF
jgi:hypothetical protein